MDISELFAIEVLCLWLAFFFTFVACASECYFVASYWIAFVRHYTTELATRSKQHRMITAFNTLKYTFLHNTLNHFSMVDVCDYDGCLDLGQITQVLAYSFIACLINDASFCALHFGYIQDKLIAANAQEHLLTGAKTSAFRKCLSTKLAPNAIIKLSWSTLLSHNIFAHRCDFSKLK